MEMDALVEAVVQFGALGILAWVLFYGLKTALPNMVKSLTSSNERVAEHLAEHQRELAKTLLASNREVADALTGQQKILAKLTVVIMQHDATVKGEDPGRLGTTEEMLRTLLQT